MSAVVGVVMDAGAAALQAQLSGPRRALFLDRDGVINVDRGYVHAAAETEWIPGIFDLCTAAFDAGFLLLVVTNQAGIARGLYDEATFRAYTAWMHAEFARRNAPLAATYYCPHHPTAGLGAARIECTCRKPAPGMLLAAIRTFGIDPRASVLLGDKGSDVLAGRAAGIGTRLLLGDAPLALSDGESRLRSLADARPFLDPTRPVAGAIDV